MSKLYIESYDSGDGIKWGLFFDDAKGKQHLTEDFKKLAYSSEDEAKNKLEIMEAERLREDSAVAFSLEEAQLFAESHDWKFATTYAKTAPHEYLVKKWLSEGDRLLFERLVQTINKEAVVGYFYGHKNIYLILGDRIVDTGNFLFYITDRFPCITQGRLGFFNDFIELLDGIYSLFFKQIIGGSDLFGILDGHTLFGICTLDEEKIVPCIFNKSQVLIILPDTDIVGFFDRSDDWSLLGMVDPVYDVNGIIFSIAVFCPPSESRNYDVFKKVLG